jgi:hypothetical protein
VESAGFGGVERLGSGQDPSGGLIPELGRTCTALLVAFASSTDPVRPAARWVLAARIGGLADLANFSGQ